MKNNKNSFDLADLFTEMKNKSQNCPAHKSYTAYLAGLDSEAVSKKFMEEAFELAVANIEKDKYKGTKASTVSEAADVIYHLLAVLISSRIELADVMAELQKRSSSSNFDEMIFLEEKNQ